MGWAHGGVDGREDGPRPLLDTDGEACEPRGLPSVWLRMLGCRMVVSLARLWMSLVGVHIQEGRRGNGVEVLGRGRRNKIPNKKL